MGRVQKKNAKNYLLIIIATSLACILCIATVVGGIHMAFGQDHKKQQDILYQNAQITKPVITQNLLTANINSRPGITLEKVKGIVVHYTANPGTSAKANRDYFESRKNCEDKAEYKVSSHFIIGIAGDIIQCIPENEIAYASNSRNKDTISIECCHPDATGKFTQKTYQSLVNLLSYLCVKYHISDQNIIRHYDVTKKICPKYYVKHPKKWGKLKKDVLSEIKNSEKE